MFREALSRRGPAQLQPASPPAFEKKRELGQALRRIASAELSCPSRGSSQPRIVGKQVFETCGKASRRKSRLWDHPAASRVANSTGIRGLMVIGCKRIWDQQ